MKTHIEPATPDAADEGRRVMLKMAGVGIAALGVGAVATDSAVAQSQVTLDAKWDKTFPKSDKVDHRKVTFKNRYGITLAGDLYQPKNASGKLAALAVSGPFGAVKEQSSGLYAQTMAERGFITLAFDPSYTGESSGEPRNVASPDICIEDFSAAVDCLGLQTNVDRERIGIIGICGWGGMALSAAAVDKRIKAVVASTMYDMTRVMSRGYNDSVTAEQRAQTLALLSHQRWQDTENGAPAYQPPYNELKGGEFGGIRRLLPHATRLSRAVGQFRQCLDDDHTAGVHESADTHLYQRDCAQAAAVDSWRKRALALFQRNRVCVRSRAERTCDCSRCRPCGFIRPDGQDSV